MNTESNKVNWSGNIQSQGSYIVYVFKWQNHRRGEQMRSCQGLGMGGLGGKWVWLRKGHGKNHGSGNVMGASLSLPLVGILYYDVERCHHLGKLGEKHTGFPWIRWICSYLKMKLQNRKWTSQLEALSKSGNRQHKCLSVNRDCQTLASVAAQTLSLQKRKN